MHIAPSEEFPMFLFLITTVPAAVGHGSDVSEDLFSAASYFSVKHPTLASLEWRTLIPWINPIFLLTNCLIADTRDSSPRRFFNKQQSQISYFTLPQYIKIILFHEILLNAFDLTINHPSNLHTTLTFLTMPLSSPGPASNIRNPVIISASPVALEPNYEKGEKWRPMQSGCLARGPGKSRLQTYVADY